MSKNVLVAGGAGYIGSHACKALAEAGYVPVTFDNLSYGHRRAVQWGPLVVGDIADTALVRRTLREHRIEAVMHFAAFTYVGESMSDPQRYFANNVINTLGLLDAMREVGVERIVFSSTCATYGMPAILPLTEEHPQAPINPYGESKLMVERSLRWYGEAYGMKWMALRYFNAAGADPLGRIGEDHSPETHLIPLVLQAALGNRPAIEVYGTDYCTRDGTAVRDYIHVDDLATAHVRALAHLEAGGASTALNLGTGEGYSVRQVIAAAEQASGHRVPIKEGPRRAGDPPMLVADPSLAERLLGWKAEAGLDHIMATAWNWHARPGAAADRRQVA
jgi:UDP-arabinose 4-epimerase